MPLQNSAAGPVSPPTRPASTAARHAGRSVPLRARRTSPAAARRAAPARRGPCPAAARGIANSERRPRAPIAGKLHASGCNSHRAANRAVWACCARLAGPATPHPPAIHRLLIAPTARRTRSVTASVRAAASR